MLLLHAPLLPTLLLVLPRRHKLHAGAGGPAAATRSLPTARVLGMSYEERAPQPGLCSRAPTRARSTAPSRVCTRALFLPFPPGTMLLPRQGSSHGTSLFACLPRRAGCSLVFTQGERADGLLTASGTPCSSCGDSQDPLLPISIHTS